MKYAALASSALAAIAQSASIPLVSVQPTYEAWCAQFGKCDGLTADRAAVFADNVEFMDVRQFRLYFGPFRTPFSAPCHPARAVGYTTLGDHAYRMLIGACNPVTCLDSPLL